MSIAQYYSDGFLKFCPYCNNRDAKGFDYGDIDTPPIDIQLRDAQKGVKRTWAARRCYCENCAKLWDVVTDCREQEAQPPANDNG